MENVIVVIILTAIVAGIVLYLWRAKRRGKKCIGCPYADQCHTSGQGGCHDCHKTK